MITSSVINIVEQLALLTWAFKNKNKFLPNLIDLKRKWIQLERGECPELIWEIKKKIVERENIKNYMDDMHIGDIMTWGPHHTHIPNHTDDTIDNYHHIRYNLFLLKPLRGGDCLYDSQKYSPNEREYIMCDATKNHSTTPIIGLKPRIVISYGFLIKK